MRVLASNHHHAMTAQRQGLAGASDSSVTSAAKDEGRILITLDRGFSDVDRYPPGEHPGIIVVWLEDARPDFVSVAVTGLLARHHLEELSGCNVIAELGGIRIRRSS